MSETAADSYYRMLEDVFTDVLGYTKDEWRQIQETALALIRAGAFDGDSFRCTVAAFVLWYEKSGVFNDQEYREQEH